MRPKTKYTGTDIASLCGTHINDWDRMNTTNQVDVIWELAKAWTYPLPNSSLWNIATIG